MLMLGELLASTRRSGTIERWLEMADPDLASAVQQAASRAGETPDQFARLAAADFTRAADDEAWTKLTSRIRYAEDPGAACLNEMVRWRLAAEQAITGSPSRE